MDNPILNHKEVIQMNQHKSPNNPNQVDDTTLYIPGYGIVDVLSEIEKLDEQILEMRKQKALQDKEIKILKAELED